MRMSLANSIGHSVARVRPRKTISSAGSRMGGILEVIPSGVATHPGYSFEGLSHVSEVPLKPSIVAVAVAGVIYFDSDGGPSTLSSFRVLPSEDNAFSGSTSGSIKSSGPLRV
ncbi:unnamed protein product [Ilex paraguariensis]|uniref:Uncharacterized protein n=1 Tax=Ilex paraguariensis TaxID=185542 RepID=A0ABC8UFS2_9AQUA